MFGMLRKGDAPVAPAVHARPRRVIVLDTETTGLSRRDRIITLGAVSIEGGVLVMSRALYLIFDPLIESNPFALRVHGYDDWILRHQDQFAEYGPRIREWLSWADLLVMHNSSFDMGFVQREFDHCGLPPIVRPTYCTMQAAKELWPIGSAKLDSCIDYCGLEKRGARHGALEDALLTSAVYMHQCGSPFTPPPILRKAVPKNFREPPPHPGRRNIPPRPA